MSNTISSVSALTFAEAAEMPLVEQWVRRLQQQIEDRQLKPGTRLPSIRQFAQSQHISRFTAVQVYDRLVAAGFLESRRGSGFFVTCPQPSRDPKQVAPNCRLDQVTEVLWLVKRATQGFQTRYMPGSGWLPGDWLDEDSLSRALRATARLSHQLLNGYGTAMGYLPLRQVIQRQLSELGIHADPEQILTTHGAIHALDLIARYLLRPGDPVLVDDPGYFHTFGHLQALGAQVIGVPRQAEGPDLEVLSNLIEQHRPRAYFTMGVLHNPTGTSMSLSVAHRVLRLIEQHDMFLIEDDIYGDFCPLPVTRLAALDQLQRVIYVNSYSKTVSAKLRVGYIAAPSRLVADLLDLKLLTGVTTPELNERVVHHILLDGHYRKHVAHLRNRLQSARERVTARLEQCGFQPYADAAHGFFVWARHPTLDCTAPLAVAAAAHDITLAAGTIFRPQRAPSPWLRFNIALCEDDCVFDFLKNSVIGKR